MGFDPDQPIAGDAVLKLAFDCVETQATGISRDNPPLVWECSVGNDEWQRILPSTRPREADTTGGLNNAQGSLVLYLPLRAKPSDVHGRSAYWIRCRHEPSQTQRPVLGARPASPGCGGVRPGGCDLGDQCRARLFRNAWGQRWRARAAVSPAARARPGSARRRNGRSRGDG